MFYIQPVNLKQWMMFEKVKGVGHIEDFYGLRTIKEGDLMLFYVGPQDSRYESGIYAYGTVIERPFYSTINDENKWRVIVQFDRIRNDRPIISHQDCLLFTKGFKVVHAIDSAYDELIEKALAADKANPDVRIELTPKTNRIAPDPIAKRSKLQTDSEQQSARPNTVADHSEDNRRIEKKIDSLIGAFATMYAEKNIPIESNAQKKETDKKFHIEVTQWNAPVLMLKAKPAITGLILSLKICVVGVEANAECYRIFFATEKGELLSEPREINAIVGEEFNCRFELKSSASEEKKVFLAVQGINAAPEKVRQLIEFPVKIAFAADFGL